MDSSAPPPQLPLTIGRHNVLPLQSQIAEQIRRLVSEGILVPGRRVPSTRALSEQLGVSRNTVTLAYELLISEGILEVESSAGTMVSRRLPSAFVHVGSAQASAGREATAVPRLAPTFQARGPRVHDPRSGQLAYDFRLGQPDSALFPVAAWRKLIIERIGRAGPALVRYGDPAGLLSLRVAVAAHLRLARGIECDPNQVVIVAGCQEGLNLVARVLVTPGVEVVVENPCYEGAALVFSSYGARLVPGMVDDEGLRVDRLPNKGPVLAYVTPSHQFPLGPTLSLARRLALLDWASNTGAYLVEDDYDSDFRYEASPLVALHALDRASSTIYLGTFSKSIGAGLRLGYVVFPWSLVPAATGAKALLDNGHPWLEQAAAADFLANGGFERHLQRVRRLYAMRRDCLLFELRRHFGECRVDGAEGGMHVAFHLPPGSMPARELQQRLLHDSVGVYSLAQAPVHFIGDASAYDSVLLLGYPCLNEERIRAGVERIARALDPQAEPVRGASPAPMS